MNNSSKSKGLVVPSSTLKEISKDLDEINQKSSKEQISKETAAFAELDEKEAHRNAEECLYCAKCGRNFFDKSHPILGYPLYIKEDNYGRYWPSLVVEMILCDACAIKVLNDPYELKNNSYLGELGYFWIPIYINEEHWERAYQDVLGMVSIVRKELTDREEEEDFKPQMVLEVLPVILNEMIFRILQGKQLHQSVAAIQAYSHFYRLLTRLLVEFPELQQKVDASVETMLKSEENRNKQNLGDICEFLIKLGLSKHGIQNTSINQVFIEEYLARQVKLVLKEDPKFLKQEFTTRGFVKSFIRHGKIISYQILVVAAETVKLMTNKSLICQADNHFGVLPKKTVDAFQKKLSWIRETVAVNGNWEALVSSFKMESLMRSEEDMAKMIRKAFDISARQGYTWKSKGQSFKSSKKKIYEDVPYNPNFDFARATTFYVSNSNNHNQNQQSLSSSTSTSTSTSTSLSLLSKVISSGGLSNSKWEDLKVDLKGFDANPIITVTVPITKNSDQTTSHKGEAKTVVYVESKKTDTANSTADNSINYGYDNGSEKKRYRNNQRDKNNSFDEKPKYFSQVCRKVYTKKPEGKETEERKPKKTAITRVSGNGTISSSTWSENGGILKKIRPNVSMAK